MPGARDLDRVRAVGEEAGPRSNVLAVRVVVPLAGQAMVVLARPEAAIGAGSDRAVRGSRSPDARPGRAGHELELDPLVQAVVAGLQSAAASRPKLARLPVVDGQELIVAAPDDVAAGVEHGAHVVVGGGHAGVHGLPRGRFDRLDARPRSACARSRPARPPGPRAIRPVWGARQRRVEAADRSAGAVRETEDASLGRREAAVSVAVVPPVRAARGASGSPNAKSASGSRCASRDHDPNAVSGPATRARRPTRSHRRPRQARGPRDLKGQRGVHAQAGADLPGVAHVRGQLVHVRAPLTVLLELPHARGQPVHLLRHRPRPGRRPDGRRAARARRRPAGERVRADGRGREGPDSSARERSACPGTASRLAGPSRIRSIVRGLLPLVAVRARAHAPPVSVQDAPEST